MTAASRREFWFASSQARFSSSKTTVTPSHQVPLQLRSSHVRICMARNKKHGPRFAFTVFLSSSSCFTTFLGSASQFIWYEGHLLKLRRQSLRGTLFTTPMRRMASEGQSVLRRAIEMEGKQRGLSTVAWFLQMGKEKFVAAPAQWRLLHGMNKFFGNFKSWKRYQRN